MGDLRPPGHVRRECGTLTAFVRIRIHLVAPEISFETSERACVSCASGGFVHGEKPGGFGDAEAVPMDQPDELP